MTLRHLREYIKGLPIVGLPLYHLYLKVLKSEGEKLRISSGPLAGMILVRFMRITNEQYIDGSYEMPIQDALTKYLCPGMVFYDVGANAGFFSLLGAKLVGPTGSVVAFEPHPVTARQCKAQMVANELANVRVVAAAVSDRIGTEKFSDDDISEMASLKDAATASKTVIVSTTTLDHEMTKNPVPDVIKIDIEGAEISALRGAKTLISQKKPILLVEVHSDELAIQYDAIMREYGYRTFSMKGERISVAQSKERFVISKP